MPIIKSAKKRVKVAKKAAVRNSKTKRSLRTAVKSLVKSPSSKTATAVQSNIDKAAKKGVIHKNKAARLKKQASATAKKAGVKPAKAAAKKATTTAKPAAKAATKTAAKKAAPVKKAVAKKAPAKKPAAKKK